MRKGCISSTEVFKTKEPLRKRQQQKMSVVPTHCGLKAQMYKISTKHQFDFAFRQTRPTSPGKMKSATVPSPVVICVLCVSLLALGK